MRGIDASPPVRLGKGSALGLSPDGKYALVLNMALPMQAVLLPTGAGQPRTLPRGRLFQIHGGAFLPDAKGVVLHANEEGQAPRLYIQDIVGGEPKAFTPEGLVTGVSVPVTPDSAWVAGIWEREVHLYPTAGGEPRIAAGTALDDVIAPDGKSYAYTFRDDTSTLYVAKGLR